MAELPSPRMQLELPPFSHVGGAYFEPLLVRQQPSVGVALESNCCASRVGMTLCKRFRWAVTMQSGQWNICFPLDSS